MREPRRRDARPRSEDCQHAGVQALLLCLRKRIFQSTPREVVTECERARVVAHHADAQATLDAGFVVHARLFEQPRFRLAGNDAHELRDRARARRQLREPREHDVACIRGNRLGAGRQHFSDEERIAAGGVVQVVRRASRLLRELGDRDFRQRLQRQPAHDRARQIADHETAWMARADFVGAIGHHQHRARALHAPAEKLQQVEGGLVGPVTVFEHDQRRRPLLQLIERRREDRVAAGLRADGDQQLALSLACDVVQRRERPRCEQRIACSPEHARRDALLAGELLQQRRLADARFAMHEGDTAALLHRARQPIVEIGETLFAFEELHLHAPGKSEQTRKL